tara:strand:+ start:324 stop:539 length:216 start_codon:yes stop_codon:yes gene_type:complete
VHHLGHGDKIMDLIDFMLCKEVDEGVYICSVKGAIMDYWFAIPWVFGSILIFGVALPLWLRIWIRPGEKEG